MQLLIQFTTRLRPSHNNNWIQSMYDTTLHDNLSSPILVPPCPIFEALYAFATSAGGGGHVRFVGGLAYPPCIHHHHHHHHQETTQCMLYCFWCDKLRVPCGKSGNARASPGSLKRASSRPLLTATKQRTRTIHQISACISLTIV